MGRRGRPKKPTELRVLEGTHRKDRHGDPAEEVRPLASTSDPPPHLTGIALEMWRALAPELVRLKLLTKIDRPQLEHLCICYQTMRESASDSIAWFKAAAALDRIARQFGMTPSARAGMRAENTDKDAEELKFFGA